MLKYVVIRITRCTMERFTATQEIPIFNIVKDTL